MIMNNNYCKKCRLRDGAKENVRRQKCTNKGTAMPMTRLERRYKFVNK